MKGSAFFYRRYLIALTFSCTGLFFAFLGFAASPIKQTGKANALSPSSAGSWAIVVSPDTNASQENNFNAVTCTSASDCWAVGAYYTGSTYQTLIERWDGTAWQLFPSSNASTTEFNVLYGVTCTSASNCWTVGYQDNQFGSQTLIEHWDGTSWSVTPSPNTDVTKANLLNGVTCTSSNNCWAVGYYFVNLVFVAPGFIGTPLYQTLVEHWDGTSWSIVTSPNTNSTQTNILSSVTCNSSSDCWSVGRYAAGGNGVFPTLDQTLVEHWDGTSWTIVSSPSTSAAEDNYLTSATCTSPANCWAVGYHYVNTLSGPIYQTLIERWNGNGWTIVTSPNTSAAQQNVLFNVTCASATDCWAAGFYLAGDAGVVNASFQTLIERWDGVSWTIVSSPNTGATQNNLLYGVTCSSPYDCWSVGHSIPSSAPQTLTIRFTAPLPPPVQLLSASSRMTHDGAGTFDIDLPLTGNPGIEPRSGGANGDYTLVFTFANSLTSVTSGSVTTGTGSVASSNIDSNDPHNYIVNLTGVTNAQTITVSLTNVNDSAGNFSPTVSAQMGVLLGDVNATGRVDAADVSQVRQQTLQPITSANFRNDINVTGRIDAADVSVVRQQTLTSLP
jgi:hypothetical protein